jgi:hypothetical protein
MPGSPPGRLGLAMRAVAWRPVGPPHRTLRDLVRSGLTGITNWNDEPKLFV